MRKIIRVFSTTMAVCILISSLGLGLSLSAEELTPANIESASETVVNLPEGTYYLRNKQVGFYADIKGPTMTAGQTIHQWRFNGNRSQKWIFDSVGGGYYTIKSDNSSSAFYLGVKNDANSKNAEIVLRTGTITNGMKWKITRTTSGAYRLTPKTGDWALATSTSAQETGYKLIQGEYVYNDSYRDEWTIIEPDTMIFYGIPDTNPQENHNHHSSVGAIKDMGGWSQYVLSTIALNSANVYKTALTQGSMFISRSHGGRYIFNDQLLYTYVLLSDAYASDEDIKLYSNEYASISPNSSSLGSTAGESYSNLKLAVFSACYSGAGGETGWNLLQKIVQLGAETAIGFDASIGCGAANTWIEKFWTAMLSGDTVSDAIGYACTGSSIVPGMVVVCGNEDLKIVA